MVLMLPAGCMTNARLDSAHVSRGLSPRELLGRQHMLADGCWLSGCEGSMESFKRWRAAGKRDDQLPVVDAPAVHWPPCCAVPAAFLPCIFCIPIRYAKLAVVVGRRDAGDCQW